jgi:hypothetical protein
MSRAFYELPLCEQHDARMIPCMQTGVVGRNCNLKNQRPNQPKHFHCPVRTCIVWKDEDGPIEAFSSYDWGKV